MFVVTGVSYNRINLRSEMANSTYKSVCYNRVLVNNQVYINTVLIERRFFFIFDEKKVKVFSSDLSVWLSAADRGKPGHV